MLCLTLRLSLMLVQWCWLSPESIHCPTQGGRKGLDHRVSTGWDQRVTERVKKSLGRMKKLDGKGCEEREANDNLAVPQG